MAWPIDYKKYEAEARKKAKWFIAQLVKKGIPRSAIATNDFSSSPTPRVYITIPYGRLKVRGVRQRAYERWNANTVKTAVKWFKGK